MKFEELSMVHATQLYDFEMRNRQWFESLIEPRDEGFYSSIGIAEHIEFLTKQRARGLAYSMILMKGEAIIARANLKDIGGVSAYVGYRVDKDHVSQGIASLCLSELLDVGRNKYGLNDLKAQALDNNPASQRVLEKSGFQTLKTISHFMTIKGQALSCNEYQLIFPD